VKIDLKLKSIVFFFFTKIWLRKAQKYNLQLVFEPVFSLSFAYISVLNVPADLCEKLVFDIFRLLDISGVPLMK
jgi:hypothetical protein